MIGHFHLLQLIWDFKKCSHPSFFVKELVSLFSNLHCFRICKKKKMKKKDIEEMQKRYNLLLSGPESPAQGYFNI